MDTLIAPSPPLHKESTIKSRIRHLPELDSLRTIAVFMTMIAHYWPVEIPYMWYGVPIFFTISGFLITTILLETYNNGHSSRGRIIGKFMGRRALRLFPIYYAMIIVFWLAKKYLSLYLWKDEFTPWFFTYTPNFLIHRIGYGSAMCFSHLWSLGVEEQFYLFWPWILLFTPRKMRLPVFVSLIVFALGFRTVNYKDAVVGVLPQANLHTLGVGAVLAWFYVNRGAGIKWLEAKRHLLFGLTFVHLILVLIFFRNTSAFWHFYRELSLCLCTFSIVLVSVFGWKGFMGYFTRNKKVQYLGTISYGIYLYHMPVPFVYNAVMGKLHLTFHIETYTFVFLCFGTTILLAAASYRYIETPFLKLKSHLI